MYNRFMYGPGERRRSHVHGFFYQADGFGVKGMFDFVFKQMDKGNSGIFLKLENLVLENFLYSDENFIYIYILFLFFFNY